MGRLLRDLAAPPPAPPSAPFETRLSDPLVGPVPVRGRLATSGDSALAVVLVHGLGGSAESSYLARTARAAWRLGVDTLRLDLRGAGGGTGDFYHAGLTAELHAAVADRAMAGYRSLGVIGHSMGGHLALRFAAEVEDPRVAGVAAVCPPLDLRTVSRELDRPTRRPYRFWVLRRLRSCLRELPRAGGALPSPWEEIRRARTFRQWDGLTVVPRFGFRDVDDYYAQASAAAVLDRLRVPCLVVASEIDPMVPPQAVEPFLPEGTKVGRLGSRFDRTLRDSRGSGGAGRLAVLWHPAAGHVAFPRRLGLEEGLLRWLSAVGER